MKFLFLALPVALLTACTSLPASDADAGKGSAPIEQRVAERWALLIKGDMAGAYQYLSPATRQITSLEKYQGSIKLGLWRSAGLDKVVCTSDMLCTVQVTVSYSYKPRGAVAYDGTRPLLETWKKDGGQWWYIPD